MSSSRTLEPSQFVLRLFGVYAVLVFVSAVLARGLVAVLGAPAPSEKLALPPAFQYSSVLLVIGSALLHRAITNVRLERQRPFRQSLVMSLIAGTLFVAFQSYGLWYMLRTAQPESTGETGSHVFVFVFALLHALHFTVAMMFLVFVTLKSQCDRYDHEYYWGVTVCAWFWHVLGIVWLAILVVFFFATGAPS